MELDPIGIAAPFFLIFIVVELGVARVRGRRIHRANDTIADLTCGMGDQLVGLVSKGLVIAIYTWFHDQLALVELSASEPWVWVLGFLGVDLCYYAYHRFSHRVNFAWATHVVHHQSEEYNLAVALRQPWFTQVYSWAFYLPLAVLGVPPVVQATSYACNLVYQFWIHTRLIDRMGPLEWVFNTPSHHRVHHGTDPVYVDRNYAGILIIWDRLFGTFQVEMEEPVYGTLKPLKSWNPLWANVAPFVSLVRGSAGMAGLGNKVLNWFKPPGWTPQGVQMPPFPAPDRGYDQDVPRNIQLYVLLHLLPVSAVMVLLMNAGPDDSVLLISVGALYVFWTAMGWAAIFERKARTLKLELTRLLAMVGFGGWWAVQGWLWPELGPVAVVFALANTAWFWRRRGFLRQAA